MWGVECGVLGEGFRVLGSGFRVGDSAFRVQGLGVRVLTADCSVEAGLGSRVEVLVFRFRCSGVRFKP